VKRNPPGLRSWTVAAVAGAVALALPYVLPVEHHGGWWEKIPGWWAWFGGFGGVLLVLVSQGLGRWLLRKPENWYD
jgi:uncharacterized membrane protein YdcZ (DUF606 family)